VGVPTPFSKSESLINFRPQRRDLGEELDRLYDRSRRLAHQHCVLYSQYVLVLVTPVLGKLIPGHHRYDMGIVLSRAGDPPLLRLFFLVRGCLEPRTTNLPRH